MGTATSTTSPNRWLIAIAGVIVMICAGTVYSWSLFTQPLLAGFGWSNTVTTWTFALAIFFLGLGAWFGGRWQDSAGPRPVVLTGIVLWGLGNLLAGLGTTQLGAWWIYLTYGIIGGLGLGMAYIVPVATVTKWFPDRRGLASGMVVMGFGLGAFFYNLIVKSYDGYVTAAKHAAAYAAAKSAAVKAGTPFDPTQYKLTPDDVGSIMTVFIISGIAFAVIGGLCALLLKNPPPGYAVAGAPPSAAPSQYSFTPSQAVRTGAFWLLWLLLFLNVTAGILIISNAIPIILELTGVVAAVAATAYGGVAIFNGIGRFFWGAVSDRIGRNLTYTLIFGTQVIVFFVLANLHSLGAVLTAYAIILLCYGGGFGTMPSFNADYFGTKYLGANYGLILTAWGVAGVVGPLIGSTFKDRTGSFSGALVPVAIMLLIAAFIPFFVKKPSPEGLVDVTAVPA